MGQILDSSCPCLAYIFNNKNKLYKAYELKYKNIMVWVWIYSTTAFNSQENFEYFILL